MAADPPSTRGRWGQSVGDGAYAVAEGLATFGLWGGAAVAAAIGKFMLGGALAALGLGVFLRFKRLRIKRKARRG